MAARRAAQQAQQAPQDDPNFVEEIVGQAKRPSLEEELEDSLASERLTCAATTLGRLLRTIKNGDGGNSTILADRLAKQLVEEGKGSLATLVQQTATLNFASLDVPASVEEALKQLDKVLVQVRPVDITKLNALCRKNQAASAVMKDKDCIVLLGPTGVGKSLTMHFLEGSTLVQQKIDGVPHIGVRHAAPGTESIVTSQLARSETAAVTGYNLEYVDAQGGRVQALLCDTPGTSDNRGKEVLISVGLTSVHALKQARTVKPVLLVSYKSLDELRGVSLVGFLSHLAQMCGDLQANVQRTFFYLFTRCPGDTLEVRNNIASYLRNIITGLGDLNAALVRSNVLTLLLDMFTKVGGRVVFDSPANLDQKKSQFIGTYSGPSLKLDLVDPITATRIPVPGEFSCLNKPSARLSGVGLLVVPEELAAEPAASLLVAAKIQPRPAWTGAAIVIPVALPTGPRTDRVALLQLINTKDSSITSPRTFFRPFVPGAVLIDLFSQLALSADDACNAVTRSDFSAAKYHLDLIQQLNVTIHGDAAGQETAASLEQGGEDIDVLRHYRQAVQRIQAHFAQLKDTRLKPLLGQWLDGNALTATSLADWTIMRTTLNDASAKLAQHLPTLATIGADWHAELVAQQHSLAQRVMSYLAVDDKQLSDPTEHQRVAATLRTHLTKLRLAATQLGNRSDHTAAESHILGLVRAVQVRALTVLTRLTTLFAAATALDQNAAAQAQEDLLVVDRALAVLRLYGSPDASGATNLSIALKSSTNELVVAVDDHVKGIAVQSQHALQQPAFATLPSQVALVQARVQYLTAAAAVQQLCEAGDIASRLVALNTALSDAYLAAASDVARQTAASDDGKGLASQLSRTRDLLEGMVRLKEVFPGSAARNPERFDQAVIGLVSVVKDRVFEPMLVRLKQFTLPSRGAAAAGAAAEATARVAEITGMFQQLQQLGWLDTYQSGLVSSFADGARSLILESAGGLVNECHETFDDPNVIAAHLPTTARNLQTLATMAALVPAVPSLGDIVAGADQVYTRLDTMLAALVPQPSEALGDEAHIVSSLNVLRLCPTLSFPRPDTATRAQAHLDRFVKAVTQHFAAQAAELDATFLKLNEYFGTTPKAPDADALAVLVGKLTAPLKKLLTCARAIAAPPGCPALEASLKKTLASLCSPAEPGTWVQQTDLWSILPRDAVLVQQRVAVLQAMLPLDAIISPTLELLGVNLANYRNYRTYRELYDLHCTQRDKDEGEAVVKIGQLLRDNSYEPITQLMAGLGHADLRAKASALIAEHVAAALKDSTAKLDNLNPRNIGDIKALSTSLRDCSSHRDTLKGVLVLETHLDSTKVTQLRSHFAAIDQALSTAVAALLAPVPDLVASESNKFLEAEERFVAFTEAADIVTRAGLSDEPLKEAQRAARAAIIERLDQLSAKFAAASATVGAPTPAPAPTAGLAAGQRSLSAALGRPSRFVIKAAGELHFTLAKAEARVAGSEAAVASKYSATRSNIAAYVMGYLQLLFKEIEQCDLVDQPAKEQAAEALIADLASYGQLGLQADGAHKDFMVTLENGQKKRRAKVLELVAGPADLTSVVEQYKDPRVRGDKESTRAIADFLKKYSAAQLESVRALLAQTADRPSNARKACEVITRMRSDTDLLQGLPEQALFAGQANAALALLADAFQYATATLQRSFSTTAATTSPQPALLDDLKLVDEILASRLVPDAANSVPSALDAMVSYFASIDTTLVAAVQDPAQLNLLAGLLAARSDSKPFVQALDGLVTARRLPPSWAPKTPLDATAARVLQQLDGVLAPMVESAGVSLLDKARDLDRNSPQQAAFVARLHLCVSCLGAAKDQLAVPRPGFDTARAAAQAAAGFDRFLANLKAIGDRGAALVAKATLSSDECTDLIKIFHLLHVLAEQGQDRATAVANQLRAGIIDWATKKREEMAGRLGGQGSVTDSILDTVLEGLLQLQSRKVYLTDFDKDHLAAISTFLKATVQRAGGDAIIEKLFYKLSDESAAHSVTGMGRKLIAEHDEFRDFERMRRTRETQSFTIADVLKALTTEPGIPESQKQALKTQYDLYETDYWSSVDTTDKPGGSLDALTLQIKRLGEELSRATGSCNKEKLRQLLSLIFAYWTLLNTGKYVGANKRDVVREGRLFYLQPHAAQVACILRLLSLDRPSETAAAWVRRAAGEAAVFAGHMAQVPTGEGKSIVLAALAIIFALLGFTVDCACYSEYLSKRDFDDFAPMFTALGILDRISYNTFQRLCEDLVNSGGSVRDMVQNLVAGGPAGSAGGPGGSGSSDKGRVLLVDEVDVFLSKFIGSPYFMQAQLRDQTILDLIAHVWAVRATPALSVETIMDSDAYKRCVTRFAGWDFLLQAAVIKMLAAVNSYNNPEYRVQGGRIGYVRQDTVSFTHLEGYKTVFAYFYEVEKGSIPEARRNEFTSIFVGCGKFSYAEIPKRYSLIMGVTGTLKELSRGQCDMLHTDYHVEHFTFLPSVYVKGLKFDVAKDLVVVPAEKHSARIIAAMQAVAPVTCEGQVYRRPIIVVFDTERDLQQFRDLADFKAAFKDARVNLMTELLSASHKASIVSQATTPNTVTLITRSFGRGTNFMCFDRKLGGVHVLQTFFADDLAEEVQIKGRTARQGYPGSYSVILADAPLVQRFSSLTKSQVVSEAPARLYTLLDDLRKAEFETSYRKRIDDIKGLLESHNVTVTFVRNLIASNREECRKTLREWNAAMVAGGPPRTPRTLVLLDGTGSMGGLLDNCKDAVQFMFDRAKRVITEAKVNVAFEMQIAIFRNYSSGPRLLLECSPWSSDAATIKHFLTPITVSGGQGNEAMEIGFWYANQQASGPGGLAQVIVLGDAKPNTEGEVRGNRSGARIDWSTTPYALPTHYRAELEKLKQANVLVHAFYVVPETSRYIYQPATMDAFKAIAQATGGTWANLDVNGSSHSRAGQELTPSQQLLTSTVTKHILASAGGEALVARYDQMFPDSGSVG